MTRKIFVPLAGVAMALALSPVQANNLSYFTTVKNTDEANFGLGYLRGVGTGTLNVSGLSGSISKAYLFWHGPTNSSDPNANAMVNFGGSSVTGTNIGFSDDNFWGMDNSQAYRADVTSIVSATGNGAYALSNFNKPNAEINGLSLMVFYDDGNAANNHDVVLFDGNDANFSNIYDADGWNATLNGVNYTGGAATMTLHVSDGQDFGAGDDGTLTFNGSLIGNGHDFNGTGVQFGDGNFPSNGALWDIKDYDVTSLLTNGTNTLSLTTNGGDALSLIVAQFTLPVGAAPPPPGVPEPASWGMMIFGFAGIGMKLRQRRRSVTFA